MLTDLSDRLIDKYKDAEFIDTWTTPAFVLLIVSLIVYSLLFFADLVIFLLYAFPLPCNQVL